MGWGDCGTDSTGRQIGYVFEATCDHEGCDKKIDRGLDNVCGDMHGEDELSCEKYFCEKHRFNIIEKNPEGRCIGICDACYKILKDAGALDDDDKEIE